ncbi:MAG: hypothetical protein MI922_15940 [Bacteroidales bacterium]|nr:hypothetical protein [Bacteroidales bacterium]
MMLFSVSVPVFHDWTFFSLVSNEHEDSLFKLFFKPQNGQRVIFINLIYYLFYNLNVFNTKIFLAISWCIMCFSLFGLFKIYKTHFNAIKRFIPVSWLFFSFAQTTNLLLSWQITLNLGMLGIIWTFYFLSTSHPQKVFYSALFYALSLFSFANGLVIYPLAIAYFLLTKSSKKYLWQWISMGGLITSLFFIGYNSGNTKAISYILHNILDYINFFFGLLALPFTTSLPKTSSALIFIAVIIGLTIFVLSVYLLIKHFKSLRGNVFTYFLLYCFMVAFLISIGRAGNDGVKGAFMSRYYSIVVLCPISIYLLINSLPKYKLLKYIQSLFFFAVITGVALGYGLGLFSGIRSYGNQLQQQSVFLHQNSIPDKYLNIFYYGKDGVKKNSIYIFKEKIFIANKSKKQMLLLPVVPNLGGKTEEFSNETVQFLTGEGGNIKNLFVRLNPKPIKNNQPIVVEIFKNDDQLCKTNHKYKDIIKTGGIAIKPTKKITCEATDTLKLRISSEKKMDFYITDGFYTGQLMTSNKSFDDKHLAISLNTTWRYRTYLKFTNVKNYLRYLGIL